MQNDPSLALDIPKLLSWVEIETPTRDGAAVNVLLDVIEREACSAGAKSKRWQGTTESGDCILLTTPGRELEQRILLHGHIDTVHQKGSLTGLLTPREEDGRLHGPGVFDMKGGMLIAFKEFVRSIAKPEEYPRPLSLMIVGDEEHGSVFSRAITEEVSQLHKAALVFEPGEKGGGVVSERKGYGEYVVCAHGVSAHAGMRPHGGQSAIVELCRQAIEFEGMTDDDLGVSCNVGTLAGGTFVNVVPERASARLDIRFKTLSDWERIKSGMEALVPHNPAVKLDVDVTIEQPPMSAVLTETMLCAVKLAGKEIGIEIHGVSNGGTSDANMIAGVGIPVIDGLGPEGAGAHTPYEYIDVASYHTKASLVRTLLTGSFIE
jgi:glutamate carboxypeptidase